MSRRSPQTTFRPILPKFQPLSPGANSSTIVGRLTRSLPLTRSLDLPVHVARLPPAPFWETPFMGLASDTDALQEFIAVIFSRRCHMPFVLHSHPPQQ